ncbi:MAG: BlaI/MecI/CopY family transcriptional regulator [Prevotellaceae bacterium]|jgi:predicted transcriptional regulator|nr:BlaI/MecI/CopY family transcriptional regulator [Prevotellaceae bacterium]
MRELTKAESEIMQILWEKGNAFVQDIIDDMPEPKPAYNTVSTIVRILEQKAMVAHEPFGRSHRYFPLVKKEKYTRSFMRNIMDSYFENSFPKMVSFFARQENLSVHELEEIKQMVERKLNEKTSKKPKKSHRK